MSSILVKECRVAIDAVSAASSLCQRVFKQLVTEETLVKKDKSPVTVADFGSQAVINAIIHKNFPLDPIVGEEDAKDLVDNSVLRAKVLDLVNNYNPNDGTPDFKFTESTLLEAIDLGKHGGGAKGRFWTLDPIDGTKGFLRGEQYAICLALVEDGQVQLGVLGCPNLNADLSDPNSNRGCLLFATRGGGAYQRLFNNSSVAESTTKIQVSSVSNLSSTKFCESVESGHSSQDDNKKIAAILGITADPIRMDSQCKYTVVARGDANIYLRLPVSETYQENIWDHAAGSLIVEEAGGVVSDINGKALDFSLGRTLIANKGIVASSPSLHPQVITAIKKVKANI